MEQFHFSIVGGYRREVTREEFFKEVERVFARDIKTQVGLPDYKRLSLDDGGIALIFDDKNYQGICFRRRTGNVSFDFDMELIEGCPVNAEFILHTRRQWKSIEIEFKTKRQSGFGRFNHNRVVIRKENPEVQENDLSVKVSGGSKNPASEMIIKDLAGEAGYGTDKGSRS